MKKYLREYSDENPERFNNEFIRSRDKQDVLKYVKDIFKSLEILKEIKVEDITLDTDEASFGPIKNKHKYSKAVLPSRLDKIHYTLRITPSENVDEAPILDGSSIKEEFIVNENSFIKEGDIYINKLIDGCFYINEGVRYYLIYQIVDNAAYGTKDCVSMKSLLMPITLMKKEVVAIPEFTNEPVTIDAYDLLLFSKKISPIIYVLGKDSYNSLVNMKVTDPENIIEERQNARDPSLITKFNDFFHTDFKFSDESDELIEDGRTIFHVKSEKQSGVYFSVNTEKFETDSLTRCITGTLLDMRKKEKKKKIIFKYDNLISPWYWVDKLNVYFSANTDASKKLIGVKTRLTSVDRLVDDATREILNIDDEDKKDTLTIIRYMMREFDNLSKMDNQDLANKRLRLFEYQFYPLRKYFSDQIYRVLNSSTRSKAILDRMFSNLNPMYVIKKITVNELLRYFNSSNVAMQLYSCWLKATFRGPQSISANVSVYQRDLHPSYTGRLSLINSNASDPGLSSCIVPFIHMHGYYFEDQNKKEE